MKTSELLKQAKAVIADSARWCKHVAAQDQAGNAVPADNFKACQFCALGAGWRVCGDLKFREAENVLRRVIPFDRISTWNDAPETTHADVMAAFDKAIALAEEEEAA